MSEKHISACVEYAKAGTEVKRLSKVIGDALSECYATQCKSWETSHPDAWMSMPDPVDHLKMAYEMVTDPDDRERYFTHHDGSVSQYLAEVCPHCLAAHKAIQLRKEARKRLGIAKRRITALGTAALEAI